MLHSSTHHIPILLDPIVEFIAEGFLKLPANSAPGVFIDCTFGGGGHTARFLEKFFTENHQDTDSSTPHRALGIDRDPDAITRAQNRFAQDLSNGRLELIHAPFSEALNAAAGRPIYGLLADLGISSDQIDSETRGFSFRYASPLDMRMNPNQGESLKDWLMRASETEIADVIWKYGEERLSRKIARKLVTLREQKKFPTTTLELADAITHAFPPDQRFKRMHPATLTFQAFRIFLNRELEELETLLSKILPSVAPQGRIAIISFHSLEDRMVKETFRNQELYDLPQRKAIQASDDEILTNPRSRSAKLRFAIRK